MKRTFTSVVELVFIFSIALRMAAADTALDNTHPEANGRVSYPWSEASDYVRVPKSFLNQITIRRTTMTNLETRAHVFSDEFVQIFKLTPSEVERVNASIAKALHDYRMEEGKHLVGTGAVKTDAEPQGRPLRLPAAIERVTFQFVPFPEEAQAIRKKLEESLLETLGGERAKFFWQSAGTWGGALNTFSDPHRFQPAAFIFQLTDHPKLGLLVDLYQTSGGGGHGITYTEPLDPYAPEVLQPALARWRKAIANQATRDTQPASDAEAVDSSDLQAKPASVSSARWDEGAPFVDVPKAVIEALRVPGLTLDRKLSPEAVTLFGLESDDQKAVSALYDQMKLRFEQLERAHFSRVEPGKISFVIRAFPEESAAVHEEWVEKLKDLVGKSRGELLDHSIRTPASPFDEIKRGGARDMSAHIRRLLDQRHDWLHRGTEELHLDINPAGPDRDGHPSYRIEYRTGSEGGGKGSWSGRADQAPERWRHLLTPDVLGWEMTL